MTSRRPAYELRSRSKYHAIPEVVDGVRFQSRREAARYKALRLLLKTGQISDLELQPRYPLHAPNGTKVGEYRADFRYRDLTSGELRVEDAKGVKTAIYQRSKKHVEAEYGIQVQEV